MVVTGGYYTNKTVSVYDIEGWVKDLPDLNNPRYGHGCGQYVKANKKIVRFLLFSILLIFS